MLKRKLIYNPKELVKALSICEKFTSPNGNLKILENVLIDSESGFYATDLKTACHVKLLPEDVQEGDEDSVRLCVNPSILLRIAKHIDYATEVLLEEEELNLWRIGEPQSTYKLITGDPKNFPEIALPSVQEAEWTPYNSCSFKKMLSINAVADFQKTYSNFVCINEEVGELASIDGVRLNCLKEFPIAEGLKGKGIQNIPKKALKKVVCVNLDLPSYAVVWQENQGKMLFRSYPGSEIFPETVTSVDLEERDFPKYTKIINLSENRSEFAVKEADFRKQLMLAMPMQSDNYKGCIMTFSREAISFEMINPSLGNMTSRNAVKVLSCQEPKDIRIAVNPKYLLDLFRVWDEGEMTISVSDECSPIILKGEKKFTAIVMPIHV